MYIKLSTLEFPRYEGDIRLEYPEITEEQTGDTFPVPEDYAPVLFTPPPEIDGATQVAYAGVPENRGGIWYLTWEVRDKTQEEIAYEAYHLQNIANRPVDIWDQK